MARHNNLRLAISVLFLILFNACSKESNQAPSIKFGETIHPFDNELINLNEYANIVDLDSVKESNFQNEFALDKIFSIGDFFGEAHSTFTKTADLLLVDDGRVLILDSEFNQVHLYSKEGDFMTSISRNGRGPGEFLNPTSIDIIDDYIVVSDGMLKLSFFNLVSYEHAFDYNLKFSPKSICTMNNSIFVQGINVEDNSGGKKNIHEFSLTENDQVDYIKSFGNLYPSDYYFVKRNLSNGRITCDKRNENVVFTFDWFPIIYSYSAVNGELNWTRKIKGFIPTYPITGRLDDGRPYIKRSSPKSGFVDSITGLKSDENGNIYLQILRRQGTDLRSLLDVLQNSKYYTIQIDGLTAKSKSFVGDHNAIGGINNKFMLTMEPSFTNTFPKVNLYKRQL